MKGDEKEKFRRLEETTIEHSDMYLVVYCVRTRFFFHSSYFRHTSQQHQTEKLKNKVQERAFGSRRCSSFLAPSRIWLMIAGQPFLPTRRTHDAKYSSSDFESVRKADFLKLFTLFERWSCSVVFFTLHFVAVLPKELPLLTSSIAFIILKEKN